LNNGVFAERSFENLYYTNLSKLMQESIQILMNENNKSFYPLNNKDNLLELKLVVECKCPEERY
jgi:hypothetical protein